MKTKLFPVATPSFRLAVCLAASLAGCAAAVGAPPLSASQPPQATPAIAAGAGTPVALVNPSFEVDAQGRFTGWKAHEHMRGNSYTFVADTSRPRSGPTSLRIRRHGDEFYGLMNQKIKVQPEWFNKTVRLAGYLRTDGATGTGGALVMQARGGGDEIMAHDHMDDRRVTGTQDWKRYTVDMKVPPHAYWLQVGVMLQDDGTMWADDLSLTVLD